VIGQQVHEVQNVLRGQRRRRPDGLGRGQRETAGEDREPRQQSLGSRVEEAVAPVERRPQGAVTRRHQRPAAGEQPHATIEAVEQLVDREHPHAGGRELDSAG
jgi:hypothetical protein